MSLDMHVGLNKRESQDPISGEDFGRGWGSSQVDYFEALKTPGFYDGGYFFRAELLKEAGWGAGTIPFCPPRKPRITAGLACVCSKGRSPRANLPTRTKSP